MNPLTVKFADGGRRNAGGGGGGGGMGMGMGMGGQDAAMMAQVLYLPIFARPFIVHSTFWR
jgi:hypothetical protein